MKRKTLASAVVLLLVAFDGISSHAGRRRSEKIPKSPVSDSPVTFNRDVAPILFHSCAMCHRPGESGPFPLLTYQDAKSHARQIAAVTPSGFTPRGQRWE